MSQSLLEAVHAQLEAKGRLTLAEKTALAAEHRTSLSNVEDEVRGAYRTISGDMPVGGNQKDWHRQRSLLKLAGIERMARELEGVERVTALTKLLDLEVRVLGLVGAQKAAKKAEDAATHEGRSEEDQWREALNLCPPKLLREYMDRMNGRH